MFQCTASFVALAALLISYKYYAARRLYPKLQHKAMVINIWLEEIYGG
ncbi:hypothetical protein [Dyadobacter sp. CY356]|nr:hypothetical protein [Dyadobacter sp. CY356]MCF0058120.1 hypothetical protein [Dyadobacter sp. CY356]